MCKNVRRTLPRALKRQVGVLVASLLRSLKLQLMVMVVKLPSWVLTKLRPWLLTTRAPVGLRFLLVTRRVTNLIPPACALLSLSLQTIPKRPVKLKRWVTLWVNTYGPDAVTHNRWFRLSRALSNGAMLLNMWPLQSLAIPKCLWQKPIVR